MDITIHTCIENIRIYLPYLSNPELSFEGNLRKTKKFTGMTFLCVITIGDKVACVASVSVGFLHKFRCFGCVKVGARAKKKEGGGGEEKRKRLQSNPWNLKTAHLFCHA